jgi:hypothetical protein
MGGAAAPPYLMIGRAGLPRSPDSQVSHGQISYGLRPWFGQINPWPLDIHRQRTVGQQFIQQFLLVAECHHHFRRRRRFCDPGLRTVALGNIDDENNNPDHRQTRPNPAAGKNQFAPNRYWEGCRVGDPKFGNGGTPSLPQFNRHDFSTDGVEFRCGGPMTGKQNVTRLFHNRFFSLAPPKRGEGWGEGIFISRSSASSPRPSPPFGEERESARKQHVVFISQFLPTIFSTIFWRNAAVISRCQVVLP